MWITAKMIKNSRSLGTYRNDSVKLETHCGDLLTDWNAPIENYN